MHVETDNTFYTRFTPEQWNWEDRFSNFVGVSKVFDREARKGAKTSAGHLAKFEVLAGLANRIVPDLTKDREQFREKGYSDNRYHREFAALIEVLAAELYASLDGIRRVLFAVYRDVKGVQNQSTEKMFRRAADKEYGEGLPENITDALSAAHETWFPSLRRLRSEITHGETGSCHTDDETGRVRYFHEALGHGSKALVVDDVVAEINAWRMGVSQLKEAVFEHLCTMFEDEPLYQVCGMYRGRIYERFVVPSTDLSFGDGYCKSRKWFLKEAKFHCPLRHRCGAFHHEWIEGDASPGKNE